MNTKDPFLVLAVAVGVCLTGAFLFIVNTGMQARRDKAIRYDFTFDGSKRAVSTFFADFERGTKITKSKAQGYMAGFFDAPRSVTAAAYPPPAAGGNSGLRWSPPREDDDYYDDRARASGGGYDDEYGGSKGGGISSFWSPGGGTATSSEGGGEASAEAPQAGGTGFAEARQARAQAAQQGGAQSGTQARSAMAGDTRGSSLQNGYASRSGVPPLGGGNPPPPPGAPAGGPAQGGRGGSLSWGGGAPKVDLDDAMDKAHSAGAKDYAAALSGGKNAVASGSAKVEVSKPVAASGGGSSGGGSSGSSSSGGSAESSGSSGSPGGESGSGNTGSNNSRNTPSFFDLFRSAPSEPETLLAMVVSDRRNGREKRYISEEDETAEPEESTLQPGHISTRGSSASKDTGDEPEPASLEDLPAARQRELRREVHSLLKRVENRYGGMDEIFRTSCDSARDVCTAHGIAGEYVTMTTAQGVRISVALKYVDRRWGLYTLEFVRPE